MISHDDLKVQPLPTRKDKIKQPPLAEANVIPRILSSSLFIGASGSGKTTVLVNLLTRREFLAKAFDRIVLVSPTAKTDDVQKQLKLEDEDIIDNMQEAPALLMELMEEQKSEIEENGADKAPLICVIFDDAVADKELMSTPVFVKCFIACRHYNFTTMLCSQSYNAVPRKCRLQAKNIIYFAGSQSENEVIMEDRCPPFLNKKQGLALLEFATGEKYNFLHIVMEEHFKTRYRKNFDQIIDFSNCREDGGTRKRSRVHQTNDGSCATLHNALPRDDGGR
jgi:hypothetical protein